MASKLTEINELQPGNILSDAVISATGKILLGRSVVLSERAISLLKIWDVHHVYIESNEANTPSTPDSQTPSATPDNQDMLGACLQFFREYDAVMTMATQAFDFVRGQKKVPVQYLKDTSFGIYSAILEQSAAIMDFLLISDYKLSDNITRHSVMVAYIAGIIAKHMRMPESDIKFLTLAALLHDIGKLAYPKADEANAANIERHEDSNSKLHVINAVALLKEVADLPRAVFYAIAQHHEYMDGTGFPLGISGANIHPYARIIAVADLFHLEAYNGDHANPFPVLDKLSHDMFGKLDPTVCQVFISKVRDSLLGSNVILTDGQTAEVIYYHSDTSHQPMVKTKDEKIIDLAADKTLKVSRIAIPEYFPSF